MEIADSVWCEFIDAKYADEYLCLYLARQKSRRKTFKVLTLIFSAGGIFSAFQSLKSYTIFFAISTGLTQVVTSIETAFVHSENEIEKLSKLRMLNFSYANLLEELFSKNYSDEVTDSETRDRFFSLRRQEKSKIEEADNDSRVRKVKKLMDKADEYIDSYTKTRYNV